MSMSSDGQPAEPIKHTNEDDAAPISMEQEDQPFYDALAYQVEENLTPQPPVYESFKAQVESLLANNLGRPEEAGPSSDQHALSRPVRRKSRPPLPLVERPTGASRRPRTSLQAEPVGDLQPRRLSDELPDGQAPPPEGRPMIRPKVPPHRLPSGIYAPQRTLSRRSEIPRRASRPAMGLGIFPGTATKEADVSSPGREHNQPSVGPGSGAGGADMKMPANDHFASADAPETGVGGRESGLRSHSGFFMTESLDANAGNNFVPRSLHGRNLQSRRPLPHLPAISANDGGAGGSIVPGAYSNQRAFSIVSDDLPFSSGDQADRGRPPHYTRATADDRTMYPSQSTTPPGSPSNPDDQTPRPRDRHSIPGSLDKNNVPAVLAHLGYYPWQRRFVYQGLEYRFDPYSRNHWIMGQHPELYTHPDLEPAYRAPPAGCVFPDLPGLAANGPAETSDESPARDRALSASISMNSSARSAHSLVDETNLVRNHNMLMADWKARRRGMLGPQLGLGSDDRRKEVKRREVSRRHTWDTYNAASLVIYAEEDKRRRSGAAEGSRRRSVSESRTTRARS